VASEMEFRGVISSVELVYIYLRALSTSEIVASIRKRECPTVLYWNFMVGFHFVRKNIHHLDVLLGRDQNMKT